MPLKGIKKEYLAGFSSERYDTAIDDCYNKAKVEMDEQIKKGILGQYRADQVRYLNVNTRYDNIKFNYSLLPLWICGYKFKEKVYRFIVNGRTGKSTGKTPLSPIKIAITSIFVLGIVALLVWLFAFSGIIH